MDLGESKGDIEGRAGRSRGGSSGSGGGSWRVPDVVMELWLRWKWSNINVRIASNFFTMSWIYVTFVEVSSGWGISSMSPAAEDMSLRLSSSSSSSPFSESESSLSWPTTVSKGSSSNTSWSCAASSSSSNSSSST